MAFTVIGFRVTNNYLQATFAWLQCEESFAKECVLHNSEHCISYCHWIHEFVLHCEYLEVVILHC